MKIIYFHVNNRPKNYNKILAMLILIGSVSTFNGNVYRLINAIPMIIE